jgi:hypothetical protein
MFTQLDDDGQEFVVVYANRSNKKIEIKYSSYEGECIALLFGQFFLSSVICMVAHLCWLLITNP